jgi:hypothetical protein
VKEVCWLTNAGNTCGCCDLNKKKSHMCFTYHRIPTVIKKIIITVTFVRLPYRLMKYYIPAHSITKTSIKHAPNPTPNHSIPHLPCPHLPCPHLHYCATYATAP